MTFKEYIKLLALFPWSKDEFNRIKNVSFDDIGDAYENAVLNWYKWSRDQYNKKEVEKNTYSKAWSMLEELIKDTTHETTKPIIQEIQNTKEYIDNTNNDTLGYINTEIEAISSKLETVNNKTHLTISSINQSLEGLSDNQTKIGQTVEWIKDDIRSIDTYTSDKIQEIQNIKADKNHTHKEYALKTDIKVYNSDIDAIKSELQKVDETIKKEREITTTEIKKSIKNIKISWWWVWLLSQLNDVSKQQPSNNQVLKYVSSTWQRTPSNESWGWSSIETSVAQIRSFI